MFGLHGCILTELLKVKYEKVASQNKIQHGEIFFLQCLSFQGFIEWDQQILKWIMNDVYIHEENLSYQSVY